MSSEYIYQNTNGEDCLKVLREDTADSKKISQMHIDNDKWIAGGTKEKLRPYLMWRFSDEDNCILVEGEKSANYIGFFGVPVTTVQGGSNGWKKHYTNYFKNKHVIIYPDNDLPGRKFALKAYNDLIKICLSVEVREINGIRKSEDAVDFLERNKGRDTLYDSEEVPKVLRKNSVVVKKPDEDWVHKDEPGLDFLTMSEVEAKEVEYLDKPYVPRGMVSMISGDPGMGKSSLLRGVTAALSKGQSLLTGKKLKPQSTAILTNEDSAEHVIRPKLDELKADLTKIIITQDSLNFDKETRRKLKRTLKQRKVDLLIIDPMVAYMGVDVDMNRANHVRDTMSFLTSLALELNLAVLCIRHLGKDDGKGGGTAIYRGFGSIDFTAAVRSEFHLVKHSEDKEKRLLLHVKSNIGPFLDSLSFKIDDGNITNLEKSGLTVDDVYSSRGEAKKRKIDIAQDFIKQTLIESENREILSSELWMLADEEGIKERTYEKAKANICDCEQRSGHWWSWLKSDRKTLAPKKGDLVQEDIRE